MMWNILRSGLCYMVIGLYFSGAWPYANHLGKQRAKVGDLVIWQKIANFVAHFSRVLLSCAGAKVTVTGLAHIPENETVLFVANHQSYFDIPAVMANVGRPVGFIAKDDLKKIPCFTKWIEETGSVAITRNDGRKALEAILQAANILKAGHSLCLFPEGTRSEDGTLGEFKAGSLKMAQKAHVAIVPIAIEGAGEVMPKGSKLIYPKPIRLTILPMISAEEVNAADTKTLANEIKMKIASALE